MPGYSVSIKDDCRGSCSDRRNQQEPAQPQYALSSWLLSVSAERTSASSLGRRPISPASAAANAEQLSKHNCIAVRTLSGRIDPWRSVRGEQEFSVPVDGTMILNDAKLALRTALSGGGVRYPPDHCAKAALAVGTLQDIL
jgi:hypothetical protein